MDGDSSIEKRYSFNIAQTNPVADSTHLGSSFSWGSSLNMRPKSNSSLCLNTTSPTKYKNLTKIDSRVAVDVQSKGLVSRIVKYHESGGRLNRSVSAYNLYSRPGQFPAVTLKKTELPYRATKQEVSKIRIPPPEKSSFYGNTISSLLKSNSVVGLKSKRTEENRPIIHHPPSENDMAPTRSVLDVLKEISRKRINSDDLETDETSKKYCNRGVNDFVDAGSCAANTVTNIVTSSNHRFKRQRDHLNSQQSVYIPEAKTSPEQAKKRVCNYNNDITSSLSSSVKSRCDGKKRALHNLNDTIPSILESHETQTKKMQCFYEKKNNQADAGLENVNNLSKVETCILKETKSNVVVPRTVSDSLYSSNEKAATNEIQLAGKPRLTLFNKKYEIEQEKDSKESLEKGDELNNFEEYTGIPFVKPKKMSSGLKNPVIERTQKSKLALMLSGLRGELYQDSDNVDSPKEQRKVEDKKLNAIKDSFVSAAKTVSTVTTTLTTVTSSCNLNSGTGTLATTSTAELKNTTPNKTLSPLVGLKLTQLKPSTDKVVSEANDVKITETNSKVSVPVLGGFSIGITSTNTSTAVFTTVTSKSQTSSPISNASNLVTSGQSTSASSSKNPNLPSTADNLSSNVTLSMVPANALTSNANATSLSNTSSNTTNSLKPVNTFVFGGNAIPQISTTTNITKTAASESLSFSNITTKPNSSFNITVPPQTSTTSSVPIFGASNNSITTTITTSSNTVLPKVTTNITFGAITTTATNITPTITTFSLNQSKKPLPVTTAETSTNASSTNTFSFISQPPATSVSTLSGNNNAGTAIQSSNSLFSFGSLPKTQNSVSDVKNISNSTSESNNLFSANKSAFNSTSDVQTPAGAPLFGNPAQNTDKNIFGSPSVVFGPNSDNKSSPFGEGKANDNPVAFSFAAKPTVTQAVNNPTTTGGFSFGSNVSDGTKSGTFTFGNTIKPTTNTNSSNIFGTVSSTTPENKNFSFGQTSNKTENSSSSSGGFSFSTTAAQKPIFSFGSSGNSTAGFTFGGVSSQNPTEKATIKPFSFGTQQPQAQQSSMPVSNSAPSNIFGSIGPSKAEQPPTFNFNSGNSTNLQQAGQTTNNAFGASLNITTRSGDRIIRRATRRLQKSPANAL